MSDAINSPPTLEALRARRDEILALAERYGASNVRVFGSVARGESTSNSDVDLLVDFPLDRSIFEMVGLWLDLQDLLGLGVSLLSDHDDLGERMRQNILHDAVPL